MNKTLEQILLTYEDSVHCADCPFVEECNQSMTFPCSKFLMELIIKEEAKKYT